jgi:hypothetical protein
VPMILFIAVTTAYIPFPHSLLSFFTFSFP